MLPGGLGGGRAGALASGAVCTESPEHQAAGVTAFLLGSQSQEAFPLTPKGAAGLWFSWVPSPPTVPH